MPARIEQLAIPSHRARTDGFRNGGRVVQFSVTATRSPETIGAAPCRCRTAIASCRDAKPESAGRAVRGRQMHQPIFGAVLDFLDEHLRLGKPSIMLEPEGTCRPRSACSCRRRRRFGCRARRIVREIRGVHARYRGLRRVVHDLEVVHHPEARTSTRRTRRRPASRRARLATRDREGGARCLIAPRSRRR